MDERQTGKQRPMATQTLRSLAGFGSRRPKPSARFELTSSDTETLRGRPIWLRVTSGAAWVTASGLDLILYAGDAQRIEPGRYGAVVTSLDGSRVVCETWLA
jgi:hypothetical protein